MRYVVTKEWLGSEMFWGVWDRKDRKLVGDLRTSELEAFKDVKNRNKVQ